MARTVKEQDYIEKRNDILNAAQRFVFAKGYERMTIQDILEDLKISNGAFYHYFDSRQAVLEALVQRMLAEAKQPLTSITGDPQLSSLEKLQEFFGLIDRIKVANKAAVVELLRVWYTDENAIIRQKVDEASFELRLPLLTQIVHQGIQEGRFSTAFPDQAGEIILSLLQGMGNTHARLLLSLEPETEERCVADIVAVHAAYMDAIERVLGAPPDSLYRTDAEAARVWVAALRANH
jgi:AcrR family transcriptional regulator